MACHVYRLLALSSANGGRMSECRGTGGRGIYASKWGTEPGASRSTACGSSRTWRWWSWRPSWSVGACPSPAARRNWWNVYVVWVLVVQCVLGRRRRCCCCASSSLLVSTLTPSFHPHVHHVVHPHAKRPSRCLVGLPFSKVSLIWPPVGWWQVRRYGPEVKEIK